MDKVSLRSSLLDKLTLLSDDEINRLSVLLTHQIIKFFNSLSELTGQVGGAYLPLKAELAPVYQELLRECPVVLAYPVLEHGEMKFGIPQGIPRGGTWLEAPYHVVEPQWLFIPGLGFDLEGARLGRGKGYYDRYLMDRSITKVALAWSEQVLKRIPMESHDCHVDFIITEKFCWDVVQQEKF